MVRRVHQDIFLSENAQPSVAVALSGALFERVTSAAFSPGLDRVVIAGVQDARPIVASSDPLDFTTRTSTDPRVEAAMHGISSAPMQVEGLSWRSFETAFNCNWMGSFQRPSTGLYTDSFRGGLDEIRYHNAARSSAAIESEFERGSEWLQTGGRDGILSARNGVCSSHLECADYEQCWDVDGTGVNRCAPKTCTSQTDCGFEGSCRLMPVPVSQARPSQGSNLQFVCAVECVSSSQCYQQECLNGPCVFCQAGTCAECQRMTGEFGIEYIEGCPDRNSFMCEEGSCLSECYSFENGVSRYLCDPATEYCRQGRCVLFDWDWPDLSPATFSGMGEMLSQDHGGTPADPLIYTEATAQFHTVQFEAYGVEDYAGAPEVQVEVRDTAMYGGSVWITLGRVAVHNKTPNEAQQISRRYRLTSPYPFDAVRLRLVLPPYSNLNGAATGLGSRLAQHCDGDPANCGPREAEAPGSRPYIGYRVGIPRHVARRGTAASQLSTTVDRKYLYGGQPTLIVTRLWVGSVSSETEINLAAVPPCPAPGQCLENRVCPYDGGTNSTDPHRAARVPAPLQAYTASPVAFDASTAGFALLNCVKNPYPSGDAAQLVIRNITDAVFVDAQSGRPNDGKHLETANSCFVTIDVNGTPQFVPCFETLGSDPNFDPYNQETQAYRTLDLELFQSFGY